MNRLLPTLHLIFFALTAAAQITPCPVQERLADIVKYMEMEVPSDTLV